MTMPKMQLEKITVDFLFLLSLSLFLLLFLGGIM